MEPDWRETGLNYSFTDILILFTAVMYYRSNRLRSDPNIVRGMEKCKNGILNVVDEELVFDEDIVRGVVFEEQERIRLSKIILPPEPKKKQKEVRKPQAKSCDVRRKKKKGSKNYLGKFEDDVIFLENFVEFQKYNIIDTEYTVATNTAILSKKVQ